MSTIIYTLAHPETGEIRYVGKTDRSLDVRKNEHKYLSNKNKTHLYCWIRSLPTFPIMEILEEGFDTETYWIQQLKGLGFDLVNHTSGGEGIVGWHHSEITKKKISLKNKGVAKPKSKENIKFATDANRGKTLVGERKKQVLIALIKARAARHPKPNLLDVKGV